MGKQIGIDIGTTVTKICEYKENGETEAVQINLAASNNKIPSIVVQDSTGYYAGTRAENRQRFKEAKIFKGFKMMLAERPGSNALKAMGYTGENTPERIMQEYLQRISQEYVENCTNTRRYDEIEKVVVTIPLIWNEARRTAEKKGFLLANEGYLDTSIIDIKPKVFEICNRVFGKNNPRGFIDLVEEPGAACAYYVNEYKKHHEKPFTGHYLVVDYGGGTLDIALCRISLNEDETPKVTPIFTEGDGFNTTGRVGTAGIAFLQDVIESTIEAQLGEQYEIDKNNPEYWNALYVLERDIISYGRELREEFGSKDLEECERLGDAFTSIPYGGHTLDITYGDIARSFNRMIRDVLTAKLAVMRDQMDKLRIDYRLDTDHFRIAMVGGFCNFVLTRMAIAEFFHLPFNSEQFKVTFAGASERSNSRDEEDRSFSVARGASLIANDVVLYELPAQYSMGIAHFRDDRWVSAFAFHKGDIIEYNKVYYIMQGDQRRPFWGRQIQKLVFRLSDNGPDLIRDPYDGVRDLFRFEETTLFHIGFAFEKQGMLRVEVEFLDEKYLVTGMKSHTFKELHRIFSPDGAPIDLSHEGGVN